jgi:hypothetical protein
MEDFFLDTIVCIWIVHISFLAFHPSRLARWEEDIGENFQIVSGRSTFLLFMLVGLDHCSAYILSWIYTENADK